jgi:hypothetical protein
MVQGAFLVPLANTEPTRIVLQKPPKIAETEEHELSGYAYPYIYVEILPCCILLPRFDAPRLQLFGIRYGVPPGWPMWCLRTP